MKRMTIILAAMLGATALSAQAAEGDWKRGRVYYRQICTTCHDATAKKHFSPNERTKADWIAYLSANKHNKGKDTVNQYYSKQYRDSIKATNAAAAKFADLPDQQLLDDVKAFLVKGAKDGDAPASCS